MKEIVVLSGKGGTGKTSIVASLAALSKNKVLCDSDVDAPDLHFLLKPIIKKEEEFWSGKVAFIDEERCTECGLCEELCRAGAIKDKMVSEISCEGCGLCARVCPAGAIEMKDRMAGHSFISGSQYGTLVHARLGISQENTGKLVALVRNNAKEIAKEEKAEYILTDGPPGIGCPVISSLSGASMALIAAEPTLSGIYDLERIIGILRHFGIPSLVCINKYDINLENSRQIELYSRNSGIEVVAKIPFDNIVTEALAKECPVVEYSDGEISRQVESLWMNTLSRLAG